MNAKRRKDIEKACQEFNVLDNKVRECLDRLNDLKDEFDRIRDEEQEYLDNMPENLSGSDKYDIAQSSISEMDTLISGLEDITQSIENMPNADDLLNVI